MKKIICMLIISIIVINSYCEAASIGGWLIGGNINESNITLTYQTTFLIYPKKLQFNRITVGGINNKNVSRNTFDLYDSAIDFYVGSGRYITLNGNYVNTLLADISICIKGNSFKMCGNLPDNTDQITDIVTTGNISSSGPATVEIKFSNIRLKEDRYIYQKLVLNSTISIEFKDADNNSLVFLPKRAPSRTINASQASYGATLTASSFIKLTANGSASEYATLNCTKHPAKVMLNTSIARNRLLIDGTPMKEYSMTCIAPGLRHLAVEPLKNAPIGQTTEMINMTLTYP